MSKNIADLNPFLILVSNKAKKAGPSKKLSINPKKTALRINDIKCKIR